MEVENTELPDHTNELSTYNILASPYVKINHNFVLNYDKNNHFSIESKRMCKILKFNSTWKFLEIVEELLKLKPYVYQNLLIIILNIDDGQASTVETCFKRRKIEHSLEYLMVILKKFSLHRPLIVQITTSDNSMELYYKNEDCDEFNNFIFRGHSTKIENFQTFFWSLMNGQIQNFQDTMIDLLPNVKNFSLILKFLEILSFSVDFYNQILINCAAKGTKDDLFTTLGVQIDTKIMSISIMDKFTKVYKLSLKNFSSNEHSILSAAVEHSNEQVIKFLSDDCSYLMQQLPFDHQLSISTSLYKATNYDVLCDLLELCDFPFPNNINADTLENLRLKTIIEDRKQFHEAVSEGNFPKIQNSIDKFNGLKIIYNVNNQSALYQSLCQIVNFHNFSTLKSTYNLQVAENEKIDSIKKSESQKRILVDANVQSSVPSDEKIVALLVAKSSIHVTRMNKHKYSEYHKKVKGWFQQICAINIGESVLKVVSSCEKLKIVFDFESKNTKTIDYIESDNNTIGIAMCGHNWIFIAAGNSDDINIERRIRGTIAHEFCHYAVFIVFRNLVKPYYNSSNTMIQNLYQNIIRATNQGLKNDDNCKGIISAVFTCYGSIENDSIPLAIEQELIVRVPEILVYFFDDDAKINELKSDYPHLFDFFDKHVLPEFKNFNMEKQRLISDFNVKTGLLRDLKRLMYLKGDQNIEVSSQTDFNQLLSNKITIVMTNFPKLFLFDVYNNFGDKGCELFETENVMILAKQLSKQDKFENNATLLEFREMLEKTLNVNIFIDCSKTTDVKPTWHNVNINACFAYVTDNQDECNKMLSNTKFKDAIKMEVNYAWDNLSTVTQEALLQTKTNFQHSQTNKILPQISNQVNLELMKLLLEKSPININMKVQETDDNFDVLYQSRNFIRKIKSDFDPDWYEYEKTLSEEELLSEIRNEFYVLISDVAGSGKSWAVKSIAKAIRKKFETKWVTYVDLKEYIPVFRDENTRKDIQEKLNFGAFMTIYILKTELEIEKIIFKQMYRNGEVIVIFDGFDEIVPDCAEFVSHLTLSCDRNEGNQLWIATRDYFEVDLKRNLGIDSAYKLDKFTDENGINLISKIWMLELNKVNRSDHTDSENLYQRAQKLVKKTTDLSQTSIGVVQLYKMLALIGMDPENTAKITEYQVYDKFADLHYIGWSDAKGQLRKEASIRIQKQESTFTKFHEHEAMKILAPKFAHLCDIEYDDDEWPEEEIIACGLMAKNKEKFYFIHRTLAEYFVATFTVKLLDKFLKKRSVDEDANVFVAEVIQNKDYKVVHMFLDEALKIEKFVDSPEKLNKISNHFMMYELVLNGSEMLQTLHNLRKFVNLTLRHDNYKVIKEVLLREILNKISNDSKNLTEISEVLSKLSLSCVDIEVFEFIITQIEKHYGIEFTKNILQHKFGHENPLTLIHGFMVSMKFDADDVVKSMSFFSKYFSGSELMGIMKKTNNYGHNILQDFTRRNHENLTATWIKIEKICDSQEFKELITHKTTHDETILHLAAEYCGRVDFHQTLWDLILKTLQNEFYDFLAEINKKGRNFLHNLLIRNKVDVIEASIIRLKSLFGIEKLLEIVNKRDSDGRNVLHVAAFESSSENFNILISELEQLVERDNMREILSYIDSKNKNLIQIAAEHNASLDLHKSLWKCFRKYFDEFEVFSFIKHWDVDGCNLLHLSLMNEKKEIAELTWNEVKTEKCPKQFEEKFFQMRYDAKVKQESSVELANLSWIEDKNLWIFKISAEKFQEHLNQGKLFVIQSDFENLAECTDIEIHKISWKFILEKFETREKLKHLVLQMNNFSSNFIHQLTSNENSQVFKFVLDFLQENLNDIEFSEIIASKGFRKRNLLQTAVCISKSPETYQIIWDIFLKQYSEIISILKYTDSDRNNLMLVASRWSTQQVFEIFWKELRSKITNNEVISLIRGRSGNGENGLYISIHSGDKNKFKFIWNETQNLSIATDSMQLIRDILYEKMYTQSTILHHLALNCYKVDFHIVFWELFLQTFADNQDELWKYIESIDMTFKNFISHLVWKNYPDVIELTFKIIEDNFQKEKLLELLKNSDTFGNNILQQTLSWSSGENFKFLVVKLGNLMEIKEMLMESNYAMKNILHIAAENNKSVELHERLWEVLQNYLDNSEILNLIKHSDGNGRNFLNTAVCHNTKEVAEFSWNQVRSIMDESELDEYLESNDVDGKNLVEISKENIKYKEVAEWVRILRIERKKRTH